MNFNPRTRTGCDLAGVQARVLLYLKDESDTVYGIAKATGIARSTVWSATHYLDSMGLIQPHMGYDGARPKKIYALSDKGQRVVSVLLEK